MEIDVSDRSNYRCDHWKVFAAGMQEYLAAKNMPHVLVGFNIFSSEDFPSPGGEENGKLLLVFGCARWEIPGAVEDTEGNQRGQALVGFLRIWGLPDCPGDRELENSKRLLDRLLPRAVEQDPEKLAAILAEQAEAERQRSRTAWLKECEKRMEKALSNTREAIKKADQAVELHQKQLVEQIRFAEGQRRKLEQIEATRPEIEQRYLREFDKLPEVPHLQRVSVEPGKIMGFTDLIIAEVAGVRRSIGAFRIELYPDGSNGCVKMFNLTRLVDAYQPGMQAPHVFPDGRPCLGNLKEAIPAYLGEYEFSVVFILCIQYLQSVNTSDAAGKYYERWPLATEEA